MNQRTDTVVRYVAVRQDPGGKVYGPSVQVIGGREVSEAEADTFLASGRCWGAGYEEVPERIWFGLFHR